MFDFTSADLASEVRAVARSYPNYKYESSEDSCAYFHLGQDMEHYSAGCIVGHALHRLGVSYEDIEEYNFSTEICELIDLFMPPEGRDNASEAFLMAVQQKQDVGLPWGKCVERSSVYN